MTRLAVTEGLTEDQRDILAAVHDFVEAEIIPVATSLATRYTATNGRSGGFHSRRLTAVGRLPQEPCHKVGSVSGSCRNLNSGGET